MRFSYGIVVGLLALGLSCPPARAGGEIYVLGGPGLSNLKGDADAVGNALARTVGRQYVGFWTSDRSMKVGLDAGLGFSYALGSAVGVAGEVRLLKRGTKLHLTEVSDLRRELDGALDLEYLEIPLLAQFSIPMSGRVRPVVLIGPVVGIRLSSKIAVSAPGFIAPEGNLGPDVMRSSYVGGLAGAGVRVHTSGKSTLLLQARLNGQFPNLVRKWVGLDLTPQDFSLLLGYSRSM